MIKSPRPLPLVPCFLLATSLSMLVTPDKAHANSTEDMVGVGSRAKAMGGAGTALSTDLAAVYYNVANLAFGEKNSLTVALGRIDYSLYVHGQPSDPAMEPLRARDSVTLGLSQTLPLNFSLGAMLNLAPGVPQYFDQGSPDPKARFVLYGQRLEQISLLFGGAYRIGDSLSVGVGASTLVNSRVDIENTIPFIPSATTDNSTASGTEDATYSRFAWSLEPHMAYYFGIHYQPNDQVHLGLTYRMAQFHRMEATAQNSVNLGFPIDLGILFELYSWYSPDQVAFGTTYQPTSALLVSVDLTWYDWSSYPGPFIHTSALDDSATAALLKYAQLVDPGFKDTVVPRLGLEYIASDAFALRTGYSYRPSPAPAPTGQTNLLDGNMHVGTFGLGYEWTFAGANAPPGADSPPSDPPFSVSLDLYSSFGLVPETRISKIEEVRVLKDYTFGGMVIDIGLSMSTRY